MIAEAAVHYLQHDGNEIEQDFFLDRLEEVGIEISALDQAHEAYMQTFETPDGTAAG